MMQSWLLRVAAVIFALVAWYLASTSKLHFIVRFENVPSPILVGKTLVALLATSKFYVHILVSVERILIGFSLAALVGIPIGLLMGRSRIAEDLILPYIEILRPIPAVAWIPLSILLWPTEESSIIYITFLGAFFPIVLNTINGVEQTPEVLVRAAQSLGARRASIFWYIVLPGALPSIVTGLAIGMGVAWFSLLAGEIISGQYGIGYFTWMSYGLVKYPEIVVGMIVIGVLGTLSTVLVRQTARPFLRWQVKER